MPRSRSRSPRRRENPRDRGRYQKQSPVRNRPRSRTKSPIIRGPSGVKSKNAVNELLLADVDQQNEMKKLMGFGNFFEGNKESGEEMKHGFSKPTGFGGDTRRGGFNGPKRGFGNGRRFEGRSDGNSNFGRDRNTYSENRSFRGGFDRSMRERTDRNKNYDQPRRERYEENSNFGRDRTERYREEDKNKPVIHLINPAMVPRRGNYFEHDNRDPSPEADNRYSRSYDGGRRFEDNRFGRDHQRGEKMYDPRFDFSYKPRKVHDRLTFAPSHNRDSAESAPLGWRNFDTNEKRYTRPRDDYDSQYSHRRRSASGERWGHDEYLKIVREEENEGKNMELVEKDSHEEKDAHEENRT